MKTHVKLSTRDVLVGREGERTAGDETDAEESTGPRAFSSLSGQRRLTAAGEMKRFQRLRRLAENSTPSRSSGRTGGGNRGAPGLRKEQSFVAVHSSFGSIQKDSTRPCRAQNASQGDLSRTFPCVGTWLKISGSLGAAPSSALPPLLLLSLRPPSASTQLESFTQAHPQPPPLAALPTMSSTSLLSPSPRPKSKLTPGPQSTSSTPPKPS